MDPLTTLATLVRDAVKAAASERQAETITGISRNTLNRRIAKPGDFTLDELDIVARFVGQPDVETLIAHIHGRAA